MAISKTTLAATAAASVLGAMGAAHATTVGTDSVTLSATTSASGGQVSSHGGTGTGTLDNGGTYTAVFSNIPGTAIGQHLTLDETDTFTGTYAGGVFTATAGSENVTSCAGPVGLCGQAVGTTPYQNASGSLTAAGGTLVGTFTSQKGGVTSSSTETFTAGAFSSSSGGSTVPLPPAVWLLGSGLLGLVGTARRRKGAA